MVLAACSRMGRVAIIRGTVNWSYSFLNIFLVLRCRSNCNPNLGVGSHTLQICEHSLSRDRAVGDYSEMACVYRDRSLFFDKRQLSTCYRLCTLAGDSSGSHVGNTQDKNRSHTNSVYEQAWL